MQNPNKTNPVILVAAIFIIIAGLKAVENMLAPLLLAAFMALLCNPFVDKLENHRIPRSLAALITVILIFYGFFVIGDIVAASSKTFVLDMQTSVDMFAVKASELTGTNLSFVKEQIEALNIGALLSSGLTVLTTIKNSISFTFIVALTIFLALCEGKSWKNKISAFVGTDNLSGNISEQIQTYILVKTASSFATGLIISASLYLFTDHKYWLLWGVLATALNFIPNIGSFLAAVPPILVSLTMGAVPAITTIIIFVSSNIIIGSYLEPKIIGNKLGLSTLIVFISMLFFGWMFGIVGTILSIPIIVCIKIALDEVSPENKISALLK
ncbi:AI-2E family transporter [Vibrio vulnificus]|nr:AI-2E family transporter [Vibrio vulnificus]